MPTLEIIGSNSHPNFTKTRIACRGIVVRDGMLLLSRETVTDWWLIPGGGLEADETAEECCIREVREETGYTVRPVTQFLTLHEYYEEWRYTSHYFICEVQGKGEPSLTEQEQNRGLVPEWIKLDDALATFARHQDYASTSEEKRGSYLREYTALCAYTKHRNPCN
ncbi:MAG: NUDIX domain-containing protein [Clostridia bacterium]|nr:NUDIX domain-containing protein [Clostridia bacterium]